MIFRIGGPWLVGLCCAVTIGACEGVSSEVGSMDGGEGGEVGQGNECEAGATKPAGDGCNTCSCDEDGRWLCTEIGCETCEEGTTRPAGDGCNECVCAEDQWLCTRSVCGECSLGEMRSDDCGSCICTELGGRLTWACTANLCPTCEAGETKLADDGCNTCTCTMAGTWSCTDLACTACTPGQMKPAGDGCNTCLCIDGTWGCTMRLCPEPLECDEGKADCNADPADECETDITDSPDHCGACDLACDFARAEAECVSGACVIGRCDEGFSDCNADPADGCETDILSATDNCGACGNLCTFAGAGGACVEGVCAVGECMAGYADCNGVVEDGCEAPVGAGGCDNRCEVPTMTAEPVPAQGECQCPAGTTCVRGSIEDEDADSEYCFPIPNGCAGGFASCDCVADCYCPEGSQTTCYDQMAPGAVFIINCPGYPTQ